MRRLKINIDEKTYPCTFAASVLKDLFACNKLLRDDASGGKYSQTAVVELLVLHRFELLRFLGLQSKRVEAKVSWQCFRVFVKFEQIFVGSHVNPKCGPELLQCCRREVTLS